jgi:hypothetical protein
MTHTLDTLQQFTSSCRRSQEKLDMSNSELSTTYSEVAQRRRGCIFVRRISCIDRNEAGNPERKVPTIEACFDCKADQKTFAIWLAQYYASLLVIDSSIISPYQSPFCFLNHQSLLIPNQNKSQGSKSGGISEYRRGYRRIRKEGKRKKGG